MGRKKVKDDGIYFTGESATDVTGSQYVVKFGGYQCLLECGLHQSKTNDYLDSYKINAAKFKFKPSEIDFLFVAHPHIDHSGLIPRLVREGFRGKIISTTQTAMVMKSLLLNSCYIVNDEARVLSKRYNRQYKPLYEEDDVYAAFHLIQTYDKYNTIYQLNDTISFQWLKNSHCIGAAQLQLILHDEHKTKKILYTSDIGALKTNNHYLENTEIPNMFNDIVIMESTYGNPERANKKTRCFDVEHLRVAINTVIERHGNVILPCFSFSKTQEMLTTLYDIFGNDEMFTTPVIIDSKLSCEICDLYNNLLLGDDLEYWEKVYSWKNVQFISEKTDSQACLADDRPKIVISSSGFCTNGRIVKYLQKYISDEKNMIIFSGYVGDNPSYLSYRIKNYKSYKDIKINKIPIPNKSDCITLSTFSSHAGYNDLLKYGSSLCTNKLILVHGSNDSKQCLANALKNEISKNDNSYKVIPSSKDMFVRL